MNIRTFVRDAIAALALAATASAVQAAVVFTEGGLDSLVDGVMHAAADVHVFTIDTPGMYEASIIDLASIDDDFSGPFSQLKLGIKQLGMSGMFLGQAGSPSLPSSFTFEVDKPGSFAAMVSAVVARCGEFGFYEINITQLAPIPEPAVWVMMLVGVLTVTARYLKMNRGRAALSAL